METARFGPRVLVRGVIVQDGVQFHAGVGGGDLLQELIL
jgi:hypothetical protein